MQRQLLSGAQHARHARPWPNIRSIYTLYKCFKIVYIFEYHLIRKVNLVRLYGTKVTGLVCLELQVFIIEILTEIKCVLEFFLPCPHVSFPQVSYYSLVLTLVSASSSFFTFVVPMREVSCGGYTPRAWEPPFPALQTR